MQGQGDADDLALSISPTKLVDRGCQVSSLYSLDNPQPPMWCIKHPMGACHIFPPRMMRWLWQGDVQRYTDRT